ncbi:MAG: hypothetical protein QOI84_1837, partial [Solirubrobacterales bacterium]|nr:hypothetical protein [Solirubrobacterales bacterium]
MSKQSLVVASLVGAAALTGALSIATGALAGSGGEPADKVVAAGDHTVVMAPQSGATLMTAKMSTSKPTDLVLQVSLECSILTTVTNVGTSTATASGQVRVWTEVDGRIVPIESVSEPPQSTPPAGTNADKVVFCDRTHTVEFMPTTQTETLQQFQETKNADAFNWLRFNVGSGEHTITVKADLNTQAVNGTAEAVVGNRTLIVEPTKMA